MTEYFTPAIDSRSKTTIPDARLRADAEFLIQDIVRSWNTGDPKWWRDAAESAYWLTETLEEMARRHYARPRLERIRGITNPGEDASP